MTIHVTADRSKTFYTNRKPLYKYISFDMATLEFSHMVLCAVDHKQHQLEAIFISEMPLGVKGDV